MNTYSKYCPNVFVAKCEERHEKGEIIVVTTKYGKENEHIVHNLVKECDGFYYYSIVRADGYNVQERARRKAEKYEQAAMNADRRSKEFYRKSAKDKFPGLTRNEFARRLLAGERLTTKDWN